MQPLRRIVLATLLATTFVVIAGCASSAIVVGKVRPAISPDLVKVYLRPPKKYEEVAVIESSSKGSFSIGSQGKMDVVVRRLKEEAAKVGANGVLLQGTGSEAGGAVMVGSSTATVSGGTAYGTGFGTSVGVMHKAGNGLAIYVEEE
jgi:hypothetical protein